MKINKELLLRTADEFRIISNNRKTFIPNYANKAFACELYLKYIIFHHTDQIKYGHNLKTLYGFAADSIGDKYFLAHYFHKEVTKTFKDYSLNNTNRDLFQTLEDNKNLFQKERYIFEYLEKGERHVIKNAFIIELLEALHKYCHREIK